MKKTDVSLKTRNIQEEEIGQARRTFLLNTFEMLVYVTDVRSGVRRSEDSARSNIPGSRAKIFTNVRETLGAVGEKGESKKKKRKTDWERRLRLFHASTSWSLLRFTSIYRTYPYYSRGIMGSSFEGAIIPAAFQSSR